MLPRRSNKETADGQKGEGRQDPLSPCWPQGGMEAQETTSHFSRTREGTNGWKGSRKFSREQIDPPGVPSR